MKSILTHMLITALALLAVSSCSPARQTPAPRFAALEDTIAAIVAEYPGEIGVALIVNDKDTVAVNDAPVYPMMSVFKVHQAVAICEDFDRRGLSLDTVLDIERSRLDAKTWSPMLKDHTEAVISLSVRELLRYTLAMSDNNASNLMFERLVGVGQTDSLVATIIPRESFAIAYSEHEMADDHAKAYANVTSPSGAASLLNRLSEDSLVSRGKQDFIIGVLGDSPFGRDRILAPLLDKEGVTVAHKTGSGYINDRGELVAHNDVARVTLPDGTHYALAVFVKDFPGREPEASAIIARISEAVYSHIVSRTSLPAGFAVAAR